MNKNILFKNIVLLMAIFIMGGISTISIKSFFRGNIIEIISNDLYKNDVTHYIQLAEIELDDLLYLSNDTFISKTLNTNSRGIYFSQKYSYKLPVIEGRFFNPNDFKKDNNYVVVGQNLKPYLYNKKNKQYYKYLNTEYEVIGILGFDIDTNLNSSILYNLINIFEKAPSNTEVILGTSYNQLPANIKKLGLQDTLQSIDIPNKGVSRIWSAPNIYKLVIYTSYICCIVGILFLIYLKSYYYRNFIKTFKILGFKTNYIYKNIFILEALLYYIALGSGALLSFYIFVENYLLNKEFVITLITFLLINCNILILFNLLILNEIMKKIYKRQEKL